MLELRYENPANLAATDKLNELTVGLEKPLRVVRGMLFSEDCYGFNFETLEKGKIAYPTQCPIFGVEIESGILLVYEDGKSIPWYIDVRTGDVISCSQFSTRSSRDIKYLKERCGIDLEEIDRVNSYLESNNKLRKVI